MNITRIHPITGEQHTLDIAVTQEQLDAHCNGALIQNAMPDITSDEREFILTGLLPGEYDELFTEDC